VRGLASVTLAAACALVLVSSAAATHSQTELVSTGPTGGNGPFTPFFAGASHDGSVAFFETSERLVTTDVDNATDVYARSAGATEIVSTGPVGGNGAQNAFFAGSSADGSRVFFGTAERLTSQDTDGHTDVYERAAGAITLVSIGPSGGNGAHGAFFDDASSDGAAVFFHTAERLTDDDNDAQMDLYARRDGGTELLTSGLSGGNGPFPAFFGGATDDGSHVWFETQEQLADADTDTFFDVYEHVSGTFSTLVSAGPAGGDGPEDAFFDGSARTGASPEVFFSTAEALTADDSDSQFDVYARSGSTTTRVSTGPAGGNDALDSLFRAASDDGARVFFETAEALVGGDGDSFTDVYERSGSATTLLSDGPAGGDGAVDALFDGTSTDGVRVVFETEEPLVAGDADAQLDLYERSPNGTKLLSAGPSGGSGAFDVVFGGLSRDGARAFFATDEPLVAGDGDLSHDVYERFGATTSLLSVGPTGGNGAFPASFAGISADGTRAFFATGERLVGGDSDSSSDVYAVTAQPGYARPMAGVNFRVPLVIAFRECTATNRSHAPPLDAASCNPPVQSSSNLTTGTRDANGAEPQMAGSVRYTAQPGDPDTAGDQADVRLGLLLSDVRRRSDLGDYAGEVDVRSTVRITDRSNGPGLDEAATVRDVEISFIAACQPTVDPGRGSACTVDTTLEAIVPNAVPEGKRSIWEIGTVALFDGGSDGEAETPGNELFAHQGIFIP
jgi:hypothetical protein